MEKKERYIGIDFLKAFCALLIVFIHVPFKFKNSEYLVFFARIAVPIFFMITGYFYKNIKDNNRELIQIKKIFKITLCSNLIYFIFHIIISLKNGVLVDYLKDVMSLKKIFLFLFLNESPFSFHLWYLNAILYVLILLFLLKKIKYEKILLYASPILLFIDLILGKYSCLFFDFKIPYVIVRNFIFVGIPYFTIGSHIKKYEEKIFFFINKKNISKFILISLFIILICFCEKFATIFYNVTSVRDHYFTTTLLAIFVFLAFLKVNKNSKVILVGSKIGKKYSTYIYIIHPMIAIVFANFFNGKIYYNLFPFIVYFISIVCSVMISYINKKCNFMLNSNKKNKGGEKDV